MIPLRDDIPTYSKPYVTIALIVINSLVFLMEISQGSAGMQEMIWKYGYVPAELTRDAKDLRGAMFEERIVRDPFGRQLISPSGRPITERIELPFREATALPASINIVTAMFLHGGWMHLLGNMLFLWIFGKNVEDRLGHFMFVFYYLVTGVIGNLAHTIFEPSVQPLVGASGAISGVMGGYILLFPHAKILAYLPIGWVFMSVKLPAWIFLGFYLVLQNVVPALGGDQRSPVAYLAHIGGFVAGMALIHLFPHRKGPTYAQPGRPIDDEDVDLVI
jgi:membrane associated rhomboid family serine protease